VTNPKADGLHTGKRWVRIPDGAKVKFREDGREGIIDGLTELVVGLGRNPDSRTQSRINIRDPDRTLAIEDDLLVLTGPDWCGWCRTHGETKGRVSPCGHPTTAGSLWR